MITDFRKMAIEKNVSCPGLFHCKGQMNCLHVSEVCDGISHCLEGDDEFFCGMDCAHNCRCSGLSVICNLSSNQSLSNSVLKQSVYVMLKHSRFSGEIVLSRFKNFIYIDLSLAGLTSPQFCNSVNVAFVSQLRFLNLSYNNLNEINSYYFSSLFKLTNLYVHNNFIERIGRYSYKDLSALSILKLKYLSIATLHPLSFKNNTGIVLIDLSFNRLFTLSLKTFCGAPTLRILILTENYLNHIELYDVTINILITSQSRLCKCVLSQNVRCVVLNNLELSSCDIVLDFNWLPWKQEMVTSFCSLALLENLVVFFFWKILGKSKVVLLVLTCTDICGVMLVVISLFLNTIYHDTLQIIVWLKAHTCKMMGVAYAQVLLGSFLCMALLSTNKAAIITFPLRRKTISNKCNTLLTIFSLYFIVQNIALSLLVEHDYNGPLNVCLSLFDKNSARWIQLFCLVLLVLIQVSSEISMILLHYLRSETNLVTGDKGRDRMRAVMNRSIVTIIYQIFVLLLLMIASFGRRASIKYLLLVAIFCNAMFHPLILVFSVVSWRNVAKVTLFAHKGRSSMTKLFYLGSRYHSSRSNTDSK